MLQFVLPHGVIRQQIDVFNSMLPQESPDSLQVVLGGSNFRYQWNTDNYRNIGGFDQADEIIQDGSIGYPGIATAGLVVDQFDVEINQIEKRQEQAVKTLEVEHAIGFYRGGYPFHLEFLEELMEKIHLHRTLSTGGCYASAGSAEKGFINGDAIKQLLYG